MSLEPDPLLFGDRHVLRDLHVTHPCYNDPRTHPGCPCLRCLAIRAGARIRQLETHIDALSPRLENAESSLQHLGTGAMRAVYSR